MRQEQDQRPHEESKRGTFNPFVDIVLPVATVGGLLGALVLSPKSSVVIWESERHSVPSDPGRPMGLTILPAEIVEVVPTTDGDKAASVEPQLSGIVLDEEFTSLIDGGMSPRFRALERTVEELSRPSEALSREISTESPLALRGTEGNETPGSGKEN